MKKKIRVILIAGLVVVFCFLLLEIYGKIYKRDKVASQIMTLPALALESPDGRAVTIRALSGKSLWLVFFDSNCEYCQMQISEMQNAKFPRNMEIWLLSTEPGDSLVSFSERQKLSDSQQIKILRDKGHAGYHIFNVTSSPSSFLYGSDGALIKQYKGVVKVQSVLKELVGRDH